LEELKSIPSVESLISAPELSDAVSQSPRPIVVDAIREVLEEERKAILSGAPPTGRAGLILRIKHRVRSERSDSLRRVVNATGVVLHTNLGRAPMAPRAADAMREVAAGYCNLEFDLVRGARTRRGTRAARLLARLAGAEEALVVNNNAAAVMLVLNTFAEGREVIMSRGELIEIGGSFRLPDIMRKSGAKLVEVGTTNKTYLEDYEAAISDKTALILKAHWSNYTIVGFTADASLEELVSLGERAGVPVAYDLGSGAVLDPAQLGAPEEPGVRASVGAGASVVTFSGDKLLGGPQAGLVVGRAEAVSRLRKNPLARAFRVDKCFLAALERTLELYLAGEHSGVPAIQALTATKSVIARRARRMKRSLEGLGQRLTVEVAEDVSEAGGGSLPTHAFPTAVLRLKVRGVSAQRLAGALRGAEPPVIPRVKEDWVIVDPRTVLDRKEEKWIVSAVEAVVKSLPGE